MKKRGWESGSEIAQLGDVRRIDDSPSTSGLRFKIKVKV
jgi:hypothetical protein